MCERGLRVECESGERVRVRLCAREDRAPIREKKRVAMREEKATTGRSER